VQTPFETKKLVISQHELRLLVDADVVDSELVGSLAGESEIIKWVELDVVYVFVVHELVVDPWLTCITNLQVVFNSSEQVSLGVRKPADRIHVIIDPFKLVFRLNDCLRIGIADQLADHLLVLQVEIVTLLGTLSKSRIEVPDKQATLV
jgi:hypothetical protein